MAQFSETEDAAPRKTATKAEAKTSPTRKSAATKGKSKSDDAEAAKEEAVTTPGIELFAPRKMEMKFGMQFNSNDNYCSDLYATISVPDELA